MTVQACLTGIVPRSEELIAATRGFDRGRLTQREAEEVLRRDVEAVVQLQREAGLSPLTDGLLNWQDLFRPLVAAWGGLSLGGLQRWFDNNSFYRQPVVYAALEPGPLPEPHLLVESLPRRLGRKAILPGPYTFSVLAEDRHYGQQEELLAAVTEGLGETFRGLKAQGVGHLQFSEPSLVVSPPDGDLLEAVRQAYEALRKVDGLQTSVQLFFAPAGPRLRDFLELPVDVLGLDLYEEDLGTLEGVDFDKLLACGCVDARNSLLEAPEEIARQASRAREALSPAGLYLCPNADLEFLPRPVAEAKVRALGQALPLLEEVGG